MNPLVVVSGLVTLGLLTWGVYRVGYSRGYTVAMLEATEHVMGEIAKVGRGKPPQG
jgi:hypothetical protein